jgi:hypothetical protein
MSYHADHLAWQQRVAQELSRASKFNRSFESFYRSQSQSKADSQNSQALRQSDKSGQSYLSVITAYPKLKQYFDEETYKNSKLNMGYSFGGKTHVGNAYRGQPRQDNPVLSRPSTSGSYRTRRSHTDNIDSKLKVTDSVEVKGAKQQETKAFVESMSPKTPGRPMNEDHRPRGANRSFSSRRSHRSSRSSVQGKMQELNLSFLNPEIPKPLPADEASLEALKDGIEEGETEEAERLDQIDDLESVRPSSAVTWKTTSSQRRYISELERLLLEERRRREELEAKVNLILERSNLQ